MKSLLERFRSRPLPAAVLPAAVMPAATTAPIVADHSGYGDCEVLLGIGPNGAQATWKPSTAAHLLITGRTGAGRTLCEHGVIQQLAQAGWRVWLVDGKRIEFLGYKEWRNVEFLAQDVDAQIRLIHLAHETMIERYALMEAGKARADEFDPIVLVIDEVAHLLAAVDQRYGETKAQGMNPKALVMDWLGNLGRLARSAKIQLVFGMQRPDAVIIDAELLYSFGARISVGPLPSPADSMRMWDNPTIGYQIPANEGAAVSLINGKPVVIQAAYNANPDPSHSNYHPGIVAAMTPAIEFHTRKVIQSPTPTITDEETSPGTTWQDILAAKPVDPAGHEVILDPLGSEESRRFSAQIQTTATPALRHLQTADSFEDGLALFPVPALNQH